MIVTKLQGGLGNQMFQYAIARNITDNVYMDLSFWDIVIEQQNVTNRMYGLNIFPKIKQKKINSFDRTIYSSNNQWVRKLRKCLGIQKIAQLGTEYVHFHNSRNMYFDGYFQSEKYFINERERILDAFSFPEFSDVNQNIKKDILIRENSVALHIRHGDYLTNKQITKVHGVLQIDYYNEALNILESKLGAKLNVFIFSDDIDYVKEEFGNRPNTVIIQGNEDYEWKDMALMSCCKHHIIANSSFSWWGAWLSNVDGINIAPKKWFNDSTKIYCINDFVPTKWIKL